MGRGCFYEKNIAVFLCILTCFSIVTTVYANEIKPYSNNVSTTNTTFSISSSGLATVRNTYAGITGTTKSAKIVTKVQKKVGIIWITVSGGSWTDTTNATNFSKSHSVQLSSKGTYRAHVEFTISGTGGKDDEITKNVQKIYS